MKILYVEDDKEIQENFADILTMKYEEVYVAQNGLEAKELFDRISPEVVISDINMPLMNGIELGRYIKSVNKHVYLIYTTAHSETHYLVDAINLGADKFLLKPITMSLIEDLFDTVLPKAYENYQYYLNAMNNEIFLHKILNSAHCGVLVLNEQLDISTANRYVHSLFGYSKEELLHQPVSLLCEDDLLLKKLKKISHPHDNKDTSEKTIFTMMTKKKECLSIDVLMDVCYDSNHNLFYIITFRDISKELSLKEQQRAQEAMLIQQNKLVSMGETINHIAHQWRQPLNTLNLMLGNMKDLYDFGELTPEVMESFIANAKQKIAFMSTTIDDFRSFFKPETHKELFCAIEAVNEIIDIIREELCHHGITITNDCDYSNFQNLECEKLYTYKNGFKQVILNLINNAKDAIISSGIENGHIDIYTVKDEGIKKIYVQDNGGGIAETALTHLFEPYFTTKGPQVGTGLGLYMSKMIAERHLGGTLDAKNFEHGAQFCLSFNSSHN